MNIISKENIEFTTPCYDGEGMIRRALIHHEGEFYVVSENTVMRETLVFSSSPTGQIEDWAEVGGRKGVVLEEVLDNFQQFLYTERYF
tara:strand:- start:295 stop:558 length:264 start_codon:yes stop_codon:yes gene_type:complete